tara:strand:+ start:382 stop:1719 length:1338 start_codon:yes stop_codon:yes gene_type:complete
MIFSLISIVLAILWIVIGTSYTKWNPIVVLFTSALLLALLLGIAPFEALELMSKGFGKIVQNIGLLILFGTLIGYALERSRATLSIAGGILNYLSILPLPYAVSCVGYLVSIPVFCDAAFVILAKLNETLSQQTKTPLVGLTVALSTGLFAPHVLIPPTPGPLAAASNLKLENLSLLMMVGGIVALILILVGGAYGNYLIKKNSTSGIRTATDMDWPEAEDQFPRFSFAILPIIVPIVLMGLGSLMPFLPKTIFGFSFLHFLTRPTIALGVGVLFAFGLGKTKRIFFIKTTVVKGIKLATPILVITGMGGGLGSIIQTVPLQEFAQNITSFESLGIVIPFAIAALLKTAQGSSTVAIITASSIVFPLLPLLGLDSEMGKIWTIVAVGVGSMTVSHANDSYFWIVSQMSGMDVQTAYRTHTVGTLLQGLVGLVVVFMGHLIWSLYP